MITRALLTVALIGALAPGARAQCCGDCNGDGMVTINELITAVNNSLVGCGGSTPTPGKTPTPTRKPTATRTPVRCALALNNTNSTGVCDFQGTYNRGCGSALNSVLATDGSEVTVVLGTMLATPPFVYFAAQVQSATTASLQGWSTDGFQTVNLAAGTLELNGNGTQLVIFPNDFTFQIQGCSFVQYIGSYTGNTTTSPQVSNLSDPQPDDAMARVQTRLEPPIPNLGAP